MRPLLIAAIPKNCRPCNISLREGIYISAYWLILFTIKVVLTVKKLFVIVEKIKNYHSILVYRRRQRKCPISHFRRIRKNRIFFGEIAAKNRRHIQCVSEKEFQRTLSCNSCSKIHLKRFSVTSSKGSSSSSSSLTSPSKSR